MNKKTITIEFLIYLIIFIIGVMLRFLNLGAVPLSDYEARIALDGLNLALNNDVIMASDQVFHANVLGVLFYIFGSSIFVSRFISALIGSFFILLPALFRQYFDRKALLILSFWLAISPTFVSLSRQIDSSLLMIFSLTLAYYLLVRNKPIMSTIFFIISLLSGKFFFWTLLLLGLTILYITLFIKDKSTIKTKLKSIFSHGSWKTTFFWLLFFYVLVSTFGLIFPNQFNGVGRGLASFLSSISGEVTGLSMSDLVRSIFFYEIAVILVGTIGLVWIFRKNQTAGLAILGVITINIIMIIIVSEKSLAGLVFLILPLMIAGSFFFSRFLFVKNENKGKILSVTLIAFSLIVFISLAFISMFTNPNQSLDQTNTGILFIVAGFALIIGAGILAGWAISWEIAGRSALILMISVLFIYTVSAMWNASTLRIPFQNEILRIDKVPIQEDLLINTIEDHSGWNYGQKNKARILVVDNSDPSLVWALRGFTEVSYLNYVPVDEPFDIIITGNNQELEQSDSFRGQEFLWKSTPAWNMMDLRETTSWVLTRRAQQDLISQESLIVWVRNSLVPGYEN